MAAPTETAAIPTKILEFLRKASSPKKANEVAEHLSITRKEANSHLYTMAKTKMVKRRDSNPVYWEVNCDLEDCQETPTPANTVSALVPVGCRELCKTPNSSLTPVTGLTEFAVSALVPVGCREFCKTPNSSLTPVTGLTEFAVSALVPVGCRELCKTPNSSLTPVTGLTEFAVSALVPVGCRELCKTPNSSLTPVTGLTEFEQRIWSCIEKNGGRLSALNIAKGVGRGTVKQVNPMLYSLKDKGRLIHDKPNKLWIIKGKEEMVTTGCTVNSFSYVIQNNPINYIYQQGESNTVNISESQNTQVGSGNIIHNLTELDQCLPSLTYPGCATAKVPVSSEPRAEMAGASPETMSSHGPRQEVNINKSTLRHSMIGNNNTMLVSCEREGAKETEENMADEETGARHKSGFDSESLSDNDGTSSENEDSAGVTTSTPRTAQSINIHNSTLKDSLIGHDTRASLDDSVEDTISMLTQKLRLENDCKLDQTSPRQCGKISIKGSSAQYINLGNNNYMNIGTLQESPESPESEEEAEEKEEELPNQLVSF